MNAATQKNATWSEVGRFLEAFRKHTGRKLQEIEGALDRKKVHFLNTYASDHLWGKLCEQLKTATGAKEFIDSLEKKSKGPSLSYEDVVVLADAYDIQGQRTLSIFSHKDLR